MNSNDDDHAAFLTAWANNSRLVESFGLSAIPSLFGRTVFDVVKKHLKSSPSEVSAAVVEMSKLLEIILARFCDRVGISVRQRHIGDMKKAILDVISPYRLELTNHLRTQLDQVNDIRNNHTHADRPATEYDARIMFTCLFEILPDLEQIERVLVEKGVVGGRGDSVGEHVIGKLGGVEQKASRPVKGPAIPEYRLAQEVMADSVWDACVLDGKPHVLVSAGRELCVVALETSEQAVVATFPDDVVAIETCEDDSILAVQAGQTIVISEGVGWADRWPTAFELEPGELLLGVRINGRSLTLVVGSLHGHRQISIDGGGAMFNIEDYAAPATSAVPSGGRFAVLGDGQMSRGNVPGFLTAGADRILAVATATVDGTSVEHFATLVLRDGVPYVRWFDDSRQIECPVEIGTNSLRVPAGSPSTLGVVTRVGGTMIYRTVDQLGGVAPVSG